MEIWSFSGRRGAKTTLSKFVQNPLNSYKSQWRTRWRREGGEGEVRNLRASIALFISRGRQTTLRGAKKNTSTATFASFELGEDGIYFPEHLLFYLEDARWILDNRERSFPSNQIKVLIPLLSDVYDSNFNPCSFSLKKREREESVIFKNFVQ